jgi:Tfp pilus assembly protein FimT
MGFVLTKFARGTSTLVEILTVVAVIVLLVAIAVPGFLRARKRKQAVKTVNDVRMIGPTVDRCST